MILGAKSEFLDLKNYELATKLKGKMVQNAGNSPQNGIKKKPAILKNVSNSMLLTLYFR